MEKTGIKYNRKEFVDNFSIITDFEYDLLPTEVKMAYLDSVYKEAVEAARANKDNGHVSLNSGYVKPKYTQYFEDNGCLFENSDSENEEYKITCVDTTKRLEISEEAKAKLDYFFNLVGNAKADAFESCLKRYDQSVIDAMETGNEVTSNHPVANSIAKKVLYGNVIDSTSELNDEEKNMIIVAEITLLFGGLESGSITLDDDDMPLLPDQYLFALKSMIEATNLSKDDSKQLILN